MSEEPSPLETQLPSELNVQPEEANRKTSSNDRTSLVLELYNKLLGLIFISIAAIGRYELGFHVTDVSFSTNMRYQLFMGLIVLGAWVYGITREDKRSIDGLVNFLLIIWAIALFF